MQVLPKMKSMKGLSMNKMLGSIRKKTGMFPSLPLSVCLLGCFYTMGANDDAAMPETCFHGIQLSNTEG